jgi:hypothetical protein
MQEIYAAQIRPSSDKTAEAVAADNGAVPAATK